MAHEGTLERFTGDGMMIFFNDPIEVPNPEERAVRMAVAIRDRIGTLRVRWSRLGPDLGLGIGITTGYATLGMIGFEGGPATTRRSAASPIRRRACAPPQRTATR